MDFKAENGSGEWGNHSVAVLEVVSNDLFRHIDSGNDADQGRENERARQTRMMANRRKCILGLAHGFVTLTRRKRRSAETGTETMTVRVVAVSDTGFS